MKVLDGEGYGKPSLIDIAELPKTDIAKMTQFINSSPVKKYGHKNSYEEVRVLVSHAASYIIQTRENMKNSMFANLLQTST